MNKEIFYQQSLCTFNTLYKVGKWYSKAENWFIYRFYFLLLICYRSSWYFSTAHFIIPSNWSKHQSISFGKGFINTLFRIWIWLYFISLMFLSHNLLCWMIDIQSNSDREFSLIGDLKCNTDEVCWYNWNNLHNFDFTCFPILVVKFEIVYCIYEKNVINLLYLNMYFWFKLSFDRIDCLFMCHKRIMINWS